MITEYLFNDQTSLYTLLVIIYMFVFGYFFLFSFRKRRNIRNLTDVYEMLTKGFDSDTIDDKSDVLLIYNNKVSVLVDISYADFLAGYIIHLRKKDRATEKFKEINNFIKKIIAEEQQEKPFDGLNDHEKNLLISIEECVKIGETASITHSLDELSFVLKGNQRRLKKATNTNNWTIPLSIIGFILTIASFFMSGVSKNDIELINNNTKTIIETILQTDTTIENDNK